jgi:hypothetical protein
MTTKLIYARLVVETLEKHLKAQIPEFYWAVEKGRQWPYAPSTLWPDQPSLDFHLRDAGDGVVVRVIHNNDAAPLAGEILLAVKFSTSIAHVGPCIEAMAKFFKGLDVSAL